MIRTLLDRRIKLLATVLVLVVLAVTMVGFVESNKRVEISVDGQTRSVVTDRNKVLEILGEQKISMGVDDGFVMNTRYVRDGSKIEVIRAIPVTIEYQGKKTVLKSGLPTVEGVLKKAGIPYAGVAVYPPLKSRPIAQGTIFVLGEEEKIVTAEEVVKFKVQEQADYRSDFGVRKMINPGTDGKKEAVYKISATGKKTFLGERILEFPRDEVVAVGRIGSITTDKGVFKYKKVYSVEATAYTPDLNGYGSGRTATGTVAAPGQIAVDPDVIALGTRVYVEGYGHAIATDTGGAINGKKIDVILNTLDECYAFGRRYDVKVYILE